MAKKNLPPKYKTIEELQNNAASIGNCDIMYFGENLSNKDFKREKNLIGFVVDNIVEFTKDVLNDDLLDFKVNRPIAKRYNFEPRGREIDLFVEGKKSIHIIEFKNPKYQSENRTGIGQILDYGREFLDTKKRLYLITTIFDINTAKTIKHYNLPITYLYMSKNMLMEYKEDCHE